MQRERDELVDGPYRRDFLTYDNHILDGDIFLQALNGFLMILDCNGELFFATHTIETYLGFHQSDVIHQSVYELVHSEDREELQRQLGMCKDFWKDFVFLFLGDHPYITSAKGLGGWGQKMVIFADVQYCTYVDIVGGSEKVQRYADVI